MNDQPRLKQNDRAVCRLCGGVLEAVLLEITQPDRFERHCGVNSEDYRRRWVECSACGAVNNLLPVDSERRLHGLRSAYYEVDLAGGDVATKYRTVMALPPERSDNWQRVARVDAFAARWFKDTGGRRRILDIGAGTGVFLKRFLEISAGSWEAIALEPDPAAARHLSTLGAFEVRQELFGEQTGISELALVTLNKVVEHIADPHPVLRAVAHALAPSEGLVYVEVPDKLTVRRRPSTDNILGALHYHLYHPRSLAQLLERAGLEPLAIERVFDPSGKITVFGFASAPAGLAEV